MKRAGELRRSEYVLPAVKRGSKTVFQFALTSRQRGYVGTVLLLVSRMHVCMCALLREGESRRDARVSISTQVGGAPDRADRKERKSGFCHIGSLEHGDGKAELPNLPRWAFVTLRLNGGWGR